MIGYIKGTVEDAAGDILLLDHGRIVARGTHEQLMNTSEVYASISDSQMGGALLE